ncbi:hypothetical protein [Streptomyces sp. NPDC002156]
MVSAPHEAMHRIFQHDPRLFSRLSDALGFSLPTPVEVTVMPTDLTETNPVERRVDTLLRLKSADGSSYLLAIESQRTKNPAKPASWAYYTSYLWTTYKLPTALMVVCQDHAVARWAQQPVTSGPPELPTLTLTPLVVGPHNTPVITDPAEAGADLALATLSAITHATDPDIFAILKALSTALQGEPEDIADPIIEFTAQGLGDRSARQYWRKLVAVDLSFYKSYIAEEIRDEGRAQGRDEGRDEGIAQGQASAILLVLEQRGIRVPDEARERITSCGDLGLLRTWLTRSLTVASAAELFEAE